LEHFIIKLIGGLIITVFLGNTAFSCESSQNIKEDVSTDVTILNTEIVELGNPLVEKFDNIF